MPTPQAQDDPRGAVLTLLRAEGRDATSFQALEPGMRFQFAEGGCVAYADLGAAWVAAGSPIGPRERTTAIAAAFVTEAARTGARPCFFGVEHSWSLPGFSATCIGAQPWWTPARWDATLRDVRSLREQLRRARAHGVRVRPLSRAELHDDAVRRSIEALVHRWQLVHPMAPMAFLVKVELAAFAEERRVLIAEQDGRLVGLLGAVPIYAEGAWFAEDLIRDPCAPNGTVELLFDALLRSAAAEGALRVSAGLAPLADADDRLLRTIRDHTRWLYDFHGLREFKAKLRPDRWEPVWLLHPTGRLGRWRAIGDVLRSFAGGSLVDFARRTVRHRRRRYLLGAR